MEEAKNNQQTPVTQPQTPETEQSMSTQPSKGAPPSHKSPLLLFIIIGAILVLVFASFFILSSKQSQTPLAPQANQQAPQSTLAPSPTASQEEQAVDSVSVDKNLNADFESVDNDLKQL